MIHPLLPSTIPTIKTKRLLLRALTMMDLEAIFQIRSSKNFTKYTAREPIKTLDEAKGIIEMIQSIFAKKEGISWAMNINESTKLIGSIGVWKFDNSLNVAEIGYDLNVKHQGKGYMHEALHAVLHFCFTTLNLKKIQAKVDIENHASKKCLLKHGFSRDSTFVDQVITKYNPTHLYTLEKKSLISSS